MSLVLWTEISKIPLISDLVSQLHLPKTADDETPQLVIPEWESDDELFTEGELYNFYIPFTSTRGVQVWLAEMRMHVVIQSLSDDLEFDMALQVLEACKSYGATIVYCDTTKEGIGFDFLRRKYSQEFNSLLCRSAMKSTMQMAEFRDRLVRIEGPLQTFYFGKHLSSVLNSFENEIERLDAFRFMMRMSQYWCMMPEFKDVQVPQYTEVEEDKLVALIEPDTPYVVSGATHFRLRTHQGDIDCELTRDELVHRFRKLTMEQFYPFDELTMYVNVSAENIRQQARPFAKLINFIPRLIGAQAAIR